MAKKKKYKNGGALGDIGKLIGDTALSSVGLTNIIPDNAYSNSGMATASNITGAAGKLALNLVTGEATAPFQAAESTINSQIRYDDGGKIQKVEKKPIDLDRLAASVALNIREDEHPPVPEGYVPVYSKYNELGTHMGDTKPQERVVFYNAPKGGLGDYTSDKNQSRVWKVTPEGQRDVAIFNNPSAINPFIEMLFKQQIENTKNLKPVTDIQTPEVVYDKSGKPITLDTFKNQGMSNQMANIYFQEAKKKYAESTQLQQDIIKNAVSALLNKKAYGGMLDSFACGGKMKYGDGGMLTEYEGFTHEQNPLGGIPVGQNALVEGGETRFENYIFSDRIKVPGKKITFAEASKRIKAKYKNRLEDSYAKRDMAKELTNLMYDQEREKDFEEQKQAFEFALGGFLGDEDRKKARERRRQTRANEKAAAAESKRRIEEGWAEIRKLQQDLKNNPVVDDYNMTYKKEEEPLYEKGVFTPQTQLKIDKELKQLDEEMSKIRRTNPKYEEDPEYIKRRDRMVKLYDMINTIEVKKAFGGKLYGDGGEKEDETSEEKTELYNMSPEDQIELQRLANLVNSSKTYDEMVANQKLYDDFLASLSTKNQGIQTPSNYGQIGSSNNTGSNLRQTNSLLSSSNSGQSLFNQELSTGEKIASFLPGAVQAASLIGGPEKTKYNTFTPETIDLSRQRNMLERQGAQTKGTIREGLRQSGLNSGAYASNLIQSNLGINNQIADMLSQSYMTEANSNAQIRNQAGMMNTDIKNQEIDTNMANRMAFQKAAVDAATSLAGAYKGIKRDDRAYDVNNLQNNISAGIMNSLYTNYELIPQKDENGNIVSFSWRYKG